MSRYPIGVFNILSNIQWSSQIEKIKDSEFVIEAVIENMEIKQKIFLDIESLVSNSCIIATNTSSLSISNISSTCSKLDRILGVHFFNPAPLMKLVEVIPIDTTDSKIVDNIISTLKTWNKIDGEYLTDAPTPYNFKPKKND